MKNFLLLLITLCMLAVPSSLDAGCCYGQVTEDSRDRAETAQAIQVAAMNPQRIDPVNPPPSDSGYTLPAQGEVLAGNEFREQIVTSIREMAREDDELSWREKRRVERVMSGRGIFGKWRKEAVVDRVAKKLMDDGAVEVTPEGVMAAGGWQQWLEIIQKAMPLILQIIAILGG